MKLASTLSATGMVNTKMSVFNPVILVVVTCLSIAGTCANANVLASYESDIQPNPPAAGWQYLWNGDGAIGDPSNYVALLPTPHHSFLYDIDGDGFLNVNDPGGATYLGFVADATQIEGIPGGHPGPGNTQDEAGIQRYAIAAYTLDSGGETAISNSILVNASISSDGLNVAVFVNSETVPRITSVTLPGRGNNASFDVNLGTLVGGDTIYVAVGGGDTDAGDTFLLNYSIEAVPEPATATLLMLLIGGGLFPRRQRP